MLLLENKPHLYRLIKCPFCEQKQRFIQDEYTKIWFPIADYCCEIMATADSIAWNRRLDEALNNAY